MKRVFKSGILALALIAGTSGAFATKIAHMPAALDPTYDWLGDGPNGSGFQPGLTVDEAVDFYGCENGSEPCAIGVPTSSSGNNIELRKN